MSLLKRVVLVAGVATSLTGSFVLGIEPALATSPSSTVVSAVVSADSNPGLAPEEKSARAKEDLTKALDLSLKKVSGLKSRLNELNFPKVSREEELKNEALRNLDAYTDYYSRAKEDLEKKNSLEEVKDLAKDVKEHRDTIYTPGVEEIIRFVLVFYNEEVLGIANDRLSKIETDVKKLDKLGVIKEDDFRGKLDETRKLLQEATNLQGEAKEIILSATSTDLRGDNGFGRLTTGKPSAKDMIENSLNNVKGVYAIFLELNQAVKKALGL